MSSTDSLLEQRGTWLRQQGRLEKGFVGDRVVPHFEFEHEDRRQRLYTLGDLALTSLTFREFRPVPP